MEEISIFLKFPEGSSVDLRTLPSTTVLQMKEMLLLSKRLQAEKAQDLVVIFAGQVLQDYQSLQDCLVRDATVLHVVPRPLNLHVNFHPQSHGLPEILRPSSSANQTQGEAQKGLIQTQEASSLQCTFYGFCKEVCLDVTPALLRFSCDKCAASVFVVDLTSELDSWSDILVRGKVRGTCYNNCGGDSANLIFKCAAHQSRSPLDRTVYLRQIKLNNCDGACSTCSDIRSPVFSFPCDVSHVMCLDCFGGYCTALLGERRFTWLPDVGYTVRCPVGCTDGFVLDPHHFYVLGPKLYEHFKEFAAEECFFREGGIFCSERFCNAPFIDCSSSNFLTCPNGHRFCRGCGEKEHGGSCETSLRPKLEAISRESADNARSRRTVAKTTKPCPGCQTPIERNGGCMHIICSRCSREFCWICGTDWGIDCMSRHWFA